MSSINVVNTRPHVTQFQDGFSEEVWRSTYKDHLDKDVNDTFMRVAKAIASVELTPELRVEWTDKFYEMMTNFGVVPGGRILANAGTEFKGTTLINCFVSPSISHDEDSIDGILKSLKNQSLTLKSEGGWGHNFSVLRPRGAFIHGIGVETPGAVKFMELFDKSSEIITSGSGQKSKNKKAKGKIRKGAMMGVMDVWHPDIIEFITAKQTSNRLQKFNVSVNCVDAFMEKVLEVNIIKANGGKQEEIDAIKWDLVFPDTTHPNYKAEWHGNLKAWKDSGYPIIVHNTVKVNWLWNLITQSTYNRNEPGILFLDRANRYNQLSYLESIASTNPCLDGNTLVAVADGRGEVTIKELAEKGEDVPVYCRTTAGKLVVRWMRNPRITGYHQQMYKITLDDGSTVRATENHKFLLNGGKYVKVSELKNGDSLELLTKYKANIKEVFKQANSNSQDYWWFAKGQGTVKAEHRLVAGFYNNAEVLPGYVVHHKDYNSLNNHPNNLVVMTKEEHDDFHRRDMLGDLNPMRRAQTEWSPEKWAAYRNIHSINNSGEKNSNYSGVTNDELAHAALALTKEVGHRFSNIEWKEYARKNNLPEQFSKWRNNHLNGILGLAKWAALECGFIHIDSDPRMVKNLRTNLEKGYDCSIINNEIVFHKTCEHCFAPFNVSRKETAFCSVTCANRATMENKVLREKSINNQILFHKQRKNDVRVVQVNLFNDVKTSLGRTPLKKEWMAECKARGISPEICRKSSPFVKFSDLIEAAANYNHRVVSVEVDGLDTVYNGTVDEFHNFYIGGFKSTTNSGKVKLHYINNLQCGEQMLAPSGVCCLGTVNLTQFVNSAHNGFDVPKLRKYVSYLVRFLDNVNEYSDAPLPEYVYAMRNKRRIGCGMMGWASALLMMRIRFGSLQAELLRNQLVREFTHAGVEASIALAEEKGAFPLCQPELHVLSPYWDNIDLPQSLRIRMRKSGIRNSSLFSMQPNGNSSILANIVSGGIEPIFLPEYIRTVIVSVAPDHIAAFTPKWTHGEWFETDMFKFALEGDEQILWGMDEFGTVYKIDKNRGLTKEVLCQDYGVRDLASRNLWDKNAEWAATTSGLSVADHVGDLQGFAKAVDSACSKTVNLPNDYSFEDFQSIYLDAYKTGFIKGLTTYRAGSMTAVLSAVDQKNEVEEEEVILTDIKMLDTSYAEVKVLRDSEGGSSRKWYVTVSLNENNAPVALFVQTNAMEKSVTTNDAIEKLITLARTKGIPERFIAGTSEKFQHDSNSTKIARVIGLLLRHGVRIKNIVSELDKIEGVGFSSFLFHLKKLLGSYIKDNERIVGETCSQCTGQLVYESGCKKCIQCGNSACS